MRLLLPTAQRPSLSTQVNRPLVTSTTQETSLHAIDISSFAKVQCIQTTMIYIYKDIGWTNVCTYSFEDIILPIMYK